MLGLHSLVPILARTTQGVLELVQGISDILGSQAILV